MRTYQPSGRFPFFGIILFLLLGAVVGGAFGIIAYLISTVIFLVILSPLIMVAVSGALASRGIRWGKIRNPFVAFILGLLLGITIYGSYWGANYLGALNDFAQTRPGKNGDLIAGWISAQPSMERILRQETGQSGLLGYVLFMAEEGMTISRVSSSSDNGITLSREMTLGYWGIEMLLTIGAAVFGAVGASRAPFCEIRRRWMDAKDFRPLGTVDPRTQKEFIQTLKSGDYRGAGRYVLAGPANGIVTVRVAKFGEPQMGMPGDMLVQVTQQAGNRTNDLVTGVLTPMEYRVLVENAQQRQNFA